MKICVICKNEIQPDINGWAEGHNAIPVAKGRCCTPCNDGRVMYARLIASGYSEKQATLVALDKFSV
jgi:hypothetical protein